MGSRPSRACAQCCSCGCLCVLSALGSVRGVRRLWCDRIAPASAAEVAGCNRNVCDSAVEACGYSVCVGVIAQVHRPSGSLRRLAVVRRRRDSRGAVLASPSTRKQRRHAAVQRRRHSRWRRRGRRRAGRVVERWSAANECSGRDRPDAVQRCPPCGIVQALLRCVGCVCGSIRVRGQC